MFGWWLLLSFIDSSPYIKLPLTISYSGKAEKNQRGPALQASEFQQYGKETFGSTFLIRRCLEAGDDGVSCFVRCFNLLLILPHEFDVVTEGDEGNSVGLDI